MTIYKLTQKFEKIEAFRTVKELHQAIDAMGGDFEISPMGSRRYSANVISEVLEIIADTEYQAEAKYDAYFTGDFCPVHTAERAHVCGCVTHEPECFHELELIECTGCPECDANDGVHASDTVTTTAGTIRQVQAENILNGLKLAIDYLGVYDRSGMVVLRDLLQAYESAADATPEALDWANSHPLPAFKKAVN